MIGLYSITAIFKQVCVLLLNIQKLFIVKQDLDENMFMLYLFSNQMVNSLHERFKQIFFIFYCRPKTGIAQCCPNKLNFNVVN